MASNGLVDIRCPGCNALLVKTSGHTEAYCPKRECRWEITVRKRRAFDNSHKPVVVSR